MKKRSGELSFESILGIAFFALLTATLLAVLQFHFSRQPGNNRQSDIATAYNNAFTASEMTAAMLFVPIVLSMA
jgi:hypothetical protein